MKLKILINSCSAIINKKKKIVLYEDYINKPYEEEFCGQIDITHCVSPQPMKSTNT